MEGRLGGTEIRDNKYYKKNFIKKHFLPLRLVFGGDRISFKGATGSPRRNLKFTILDYRLPINSYGTKISFSYIFSEFDMQKEFKEFDMGGKSTVLI